MSTNQRIVSAGWSLLWRHARSLWFLFGANVLLVFCSTWPLRTRLGTALDHSPAALRINRGFDLPTFMELLRNPAISLASAMQVSTLANALFFLLTLFVTGGILEEYRLDRRLTTGQFFLACGHFWWRWVRLLIFLAIFMIPVLMAGSLWNGFVSKITEESSNEVLAFWMRLAGAVVLLLTFFCVRLWFDLAQVRMVAENSSGTLQSIAAALRLVRSNFGQLFWMYFLISFVGWAALALGLWTWLEIIPAQDYVLSWIVLEFVLFIWFMTRWWQRASETAWYKQYQPPQAMDFSI